MEACILLCRRGQKRRYTRKFELGLVVSLIANKMLDAREGKTVTSRGWRDAPLSAFVYDILRPYEFMTASACSFEVGREVSEPRKQSAINGNPSHNLTHTANSSGGMAPFAILCFPILSFGTLDFIVAFEGGSLSRASHSSSVAMCP